MFELLYGSSVATIAALSRALVPSYASVKLVLDDFGYPNLYPTQMSTIPDLPEPVHANVDSFLSRRYGTEVSNYFSGTVNFQSGRRTLHYRAVRYRRHA